MRLYKFLQDTDGTPTHGTGRWSMPRGKRPGAWRKERGSLQLCERGTLHYCEPDQLARWIAPVLVEVEVRGETLRERDKCGALEMRVVRLVTAWNETTQRRFAVACAYGALLAERERGREFARRWFSQYEKHTDDFRFADGKTKAEVAEAIRALPDCPTRAQIVAVVGNDSWVTPQKCDECGRTKWELVQVGEEPDYESHTANLCRICLCRALELLDSDRS